MKSASVSSRRGRRNSGASAAVSGVDGASMSNAAASSGSHGSRVGAFIAACVRSRSRTSSSPVVADTPMRRRTSPRNGW